MKLSRKFLILLNYGIGHVLSKPMLWLDWGWLYKPYSYFICKSSRLDNEDWWWSSVEGEKTVDTKPPTPINKG